MNSRHWLSAALASLFVSACTLLPAEAQQKIGNSRYYAGDEYTAPEPGSAVSTHSHASYNKAANSSTIVNNNASNLTSASLTDDCDACNDACDVCDPCADPGMWFVEAEGLLWWRKSRALPPLVTTSLPNTLQANAGVLGLDSTRILFGNDNYEDNPQAGGRIWFGRWLGPEQQVGIAGSFFALGQDDVGYRSPAQTQNDILAMPYLNSATSMPDALLVNFPGVTQNGRINISSQNDILGADVYLRKLICADSCFRVDAIGGYQFSRVDDSLSINANYDDVAGIPNSNFDVTDIFDVHNEFHGGSVGFLAYVDRGPWTVKMLGKCGVGNMHQTATINGFTTNTPVAGTSDTTLGGLYTQPTNIGTYENDELVFIPEAKINFGYRLTNNWTFSAGYSFIYWSEIVTAGQVFDNRVNPTQIPGPIVGPATPAPPTFLGTNDYWVQGLNFSAEFVY
jgi:hypothetical protein